MRSKVLKAEMSITDSRIPKKIQNIIEKYIDADLFTCNDVKALLKDLEANGYTFDYGLDCQPFNIRPNGK